MQQIDVSYTSQLSSLSIIWLVLPNQPSIHFMWQALFSTNNAKLGVILLCTEFLLGNNFKNYVNLGLPFPFFFSETTKSNYSLLSERQVRQKCTFMPLHEKQLNIWHKSKKSNST
jgi:hypothetical protein